MGTNLTPCMLALQRKHHFCRMRPGCNSMSPQRAILPDAWPGWSCTIQYCKGDVQRPGRSIVGPLCGPCALSDTSRALPACSGASAARCGGPAGGRGALLGRLGGQRPAHHSRRRGRRRRRVRRGPERPGPEGCCGRQIRRVCPERAAEALPRLRRPAPEQPRAAAT